MDSTNSSSSTSCALKKKRKKKRCALPSQDEQDLIYEKVASVGDPAVSAGPKQKSEATNELATFHDRILDDDQEECKTVGQTYATLTAMWEFAKSSLRFLTNADEEAQVDSEAANGTDDFASSDDGSDDSALATGKDEILAAAKPCHIVILIDTSGSMRKSDVIGPSEMVESRICAVLRTLPKFVDMQTKDVKKHKLMVKRTIFSFLSFNVEARIHFEREEAQRANQWFSTPSNYSIAPMLGTHFACGFEAVSELLGKGGSEDGSRHVVLFSDGRPGDSKAMILYLQKMLSSHQDVKVHCVGFGELDSFGHLQQVSAIGNGSFCVARHDMSSLEHAFSSVSSTITATRVASAHSFTFGNDDASEDADDSVQTLRAVTFESVDNRSAESTDRKTHVATRIKFSCNNNQHHRYLKGTAVYMNDRLVIEMYDEHVNLTVHQRRNPFTRGGMRLVYGFSDPNVKDGRDMVAKWSRYSDPKHNTYEAVRKFAFSQSIASYTAWVYNAALRDKRIDSRISFTPCFLYGIEGAYMIAERYLPGIFEKYNSNCGYVNAFAAHSEFAQAFSHFSYELSGLQTIVLDLQGVHSRSQYGSKSSFTLIFSDPQVLSHDRSFGPGDLGTRGIDLFFRRHRCGVTCKLLGLKSRSSAPVESAWSKGRSTHCADAADPHVCSQESDKTETMQHDKNNPRLSEMTACRLEEECYDESDAWLQHWKERQKQAADEECNDESDAWLQHWKEQQKLRRTNSPTRTQVDAGAHAAANELNNADTHEGIQDMSQEAHLCDTTSTSATTETPQTMLVMDIRFTQRNISPVFRDGRPVYELVNDLVAGKVDPMTNLEPLHVVWLQDKWRSLSNRRLWALKSFQAFSSDNVHVRVKVRSVEDCKAELKSKFTSVNDGMSVIMSRSRSPSPATPRRH